MSRAPLAVVVSGFPRQSETFALNELLAMDRDGLLGALFATKPGDGRPPHPGARRLLSRVHVLTAGSPGEQAAEAVRRLGGRRVAGVHAYFGHAPAAVAADLASRLGVPYGFSLHAKDARKVAPAELAARAVRAACVIACNADVAGELPSGVRVSVLPHGVDLRRFRYRRRRQGRTFRLLAVGRLVEKKGFTHLIEAARRLDIPWRLRIIGDGPLHIALTRQIDRSGVAARVRLVAGMSHTRLPSAYQSADVVVVPSIVDADGDRDGLPNVALEAMASGRPLVASDVGAMGSVVRDGRTGLLVAPGDAASIAASLSRLAHDPALARRLAMAGRRLVERDFELTRCASRFCGALRRAYG